MYKGKKILVTGGDGYLGTHVRNFFEAETASRRSGWNFLDPSLAARYQEFDVIIHLAALVDKRPESAADCFHVNSLGALKLGEWARPGQTIMFASTKDVYNSQSELYLAVPETCSTAYEAQNAYAWSKLIGEDYLQFAAKAKGFRLGIFRLSTIFAPPSPGNRGGWVSGFAQTIRQGENLILKEQGRQIRDVLPVSELVRALALFIDSDLWFEIFNLGGGPEYAASLKDFAERLERLLGKSGCLHLTDTKLVGEQIRYISHVGRLWEKLTWKPAFDLDQALLEA